MSAELAPREPAGFLHALSGTLPAPTHRSRGHNPQCGDDLSVELFVMAANGEPFTAEVGAA